MQLFCFMTDKSRQKSKYLENEKKFWGKIKSISIIFKVLSIAKNFLRPESEPLTVQPDGNTWNQKNIFFPSRAFADLTICNSHPFNKYDIVTAQYTITIFWFIYYLKP